MALLDSPLLSALVGPDVCKISLQTWLGDHTCSLASPPLLSIKSLSGEFSVGPASAKLTETSLDNRNQVYHRKQGGLHVRRWEGDIDDIP